MTEQNKTFAVRAFRWERYVTYASIEAFDADSALKIAREKDQNGDFDYHEYTGDAELADYFIAEVEGDLESDEITSEIPGLIYSYNVLPLLKRAESFVNGGGDPKLLADLRNFIERVEGK